MCIRDRDESFAIIHNDASKETIELTQAIGKSVLGAYSKRDPVLTIGKGVLEGAPGQMFFGSSWLLITFLLLLILLLLSAVILLSYWYIKALEQNRKLSVQILEKQEIPFVRDELLYHSKLQPETELRRRPSMEQGPELIQKLSSASGSTLLYIRQKSPSIPSPTVQGPVGSERNSEPSPMGVQSLGLAQVLAFDNFKLDREDSDKNEAKDKQVTVAQDERRATSTILGRIAHMRSDSQSKNETKAWTGKKTKSGRADSIVEEAQVGPLQLEHRLSAHEVTTSPPLRSCMPNVIFENGRFNLKFEDIQKIGEGANGDVYKARERMERTTYAVKVIKFSWRESQDISEGQHFREVLSLQKVSHVTNHNNIVKYFQFWLEEIEENSPSVVLEGESKEEEEGESSEQFSRTLSNGLELSDYGFTWEEKEASPPSKQRKLRRGPSDLNSQILRTDEELKSSHVIALHIQMEYCPRTLKDFLESRSEAVDPRQAFHFFKQIVDGVAFIHRKHIIHRDLKPANIFIVQDRLIKIGDFGLARLPQLEEEIGEIAEEMSGRPRTIKKTFSFTSGIGTPLYFAPEQAYKHYDQKVDIYALGLIYLELSVRFQTAHEKHMVFKRLRSGGPLPELLSGDPRLHLQKAIIQRLVAKSPQERPNASDILKMEEFNALQRAFPPNEEDFYFH
eukprot:TRINITY_DN6861_c0_g2_i1.p1 TRINITY_DN6861_c0_g2~~TRINITY_DN6861_c0_g2_i1.p1  ORF type:complete len:678 (-),score=130.01 TRINITY_DN6861_c0_g2_i1:103-2136(-)